MKKVINSPKAPKAIGPYSQAIEANGTLYISGQLPIDVNTGKFVEGGVKEQTEQCLKNIKERADILKSKFDGKFPDDFEIIPVCALRKYGIENLKQTIIT